MKRTLMVIDPSMHHPEIASYNNMVHSSPVPTTYHLPVLSEQNSMKDELDNTCGVVLMGSAASVYDDYGWIKRISEILIQAAEKQIPILGICFGHQLIAHVFDGKVDFLWNKVKKKGLRQVNLSKNALWGESQSGELIYSHQEGVTVCPPNFNITASSEMVVIDGIAHQSKPIWGFQPHIEATTSFAKRNGVNPDDFGNAFQFGSKIMKTFLSQFKSD